MLREIKKSHSNFNTSAWWKELARICALTMYPISKWKHVQRHKKLNNAHPRVEIFGCDLIMDSKFKIYLLEANTMAGLSRSPERFPDENCKAKDCTKNGCKYCKGVKNPQAREVNSVTEKLVNATMDILQLDCNKKDLSKTLINLHELVGKD